MTLRDIRQNFEDFFFAPQSPTPIGLFRIFYGICVSATLLLLHGDWLGWFGVRGWITQSTMTTVEPGVRLNLFSILPQDDRWISAFFWFSLIFAVLLTVGLWTRFTSIVVFLCVASIQQRNLFITHGGDTFLRVCGFFLMFAPAGAAFSLDRLIRVRSGKESAEIAPRAPWAQRMIQFELALLYFISFWWKMKGHSWINGTALYYVIHLHEMRRFPIPHWLENPVIEKLGSWYTLAIEGALGTLIWFRRFRYPLLVLGALFHLCLEYAINAPMFEWDVLAAYVLFIDPEDLDRWLKSIRSRFLHS